MGYFITSKVLLDIPYTLDVEEKQKIDKFLGFLEETGVGDIISKYVKNNTSKGGRPNVDYYRLFAVIIYAFSYSKATLRQIETLCRFDLRYLHMMYGVAPDFTTISRFINNILLENEREIFYLITFAVAREMKLTFDNFYIDGTKIEANANKYKFVRKPLTFHGRLSKRINEIIKKYDLIKNYKEVQYIDSKTVAYALTHLSEKEMDTKEKENITKALASMLEKILDYEFKEETCGEDRNSYYKTDKDATAMALKSDYYSGKGTNMHAAYNVQIAVSNGIVMNYLVTQSRADLHDFIPLLNNFFIKFGFFPKNICADSGYGNLENYKYMEQNNITSFVKHQSWEGNTTGRYPDVYKYISDNNYECINGNKSKVVLIPERHHKKKDSIFIKFENCNSCGFKDYCKRFMRDKSEDFKIFEVVNEFERLKQDSVNNLLSVLGIQMRVNRSIQVEGVFGNVKSNYGYNRFRRRGLDKASLEVMLTFLGQTIRKYFDYLETGKLPNYWIIPNGIEPQKFKKPSVKKLSKKGLRLWKRTYKN